MKQLSRVVWSEGMYLGPHHFQAQSRFFEETIRFALSAVAPNGYGLLSCTFDAEALKNGLLSLRSARGVLPDGTPFDAPDHDELPAARNMDGLYQPSGAGMEVLLALPVQRRGSNFAEASLNGEPPTSRFRIQSFQLPDETLGRGEAEVHLGRKNLALLAPQEIFQSGEQRAWVSLPVARIIRSYSGVLAFDPEFVPTCLRVGASVRLTTLLESLLAAVAERSEKAARADGGRSPSGMSPRDVMQFWFRHTVHATLPRLAHLLRENCHPEALHFELSRMAGGLCSFVVNSSPGTLPKYDHLRPGASIKALDDHIRRHLDVVFPADSVRIPLKPVSKKVWEGTLEDPRVLGKGRWILGVRSTAGTAAVIAQTPEVVKICSARFIEKLVERGLPGMHLQHLRVPPAECSPSREFQYFALDRSGPCWQDTTRNNKVGIYVPDTLPDLEMELIAMLDG